MLSIKELNHTYPNDVNALSEINLTINKGMFGLLGPNGAGKSSLMRILATLQRPTAGNVLFNHTNLLEHPEKVRQVLGYLPQDFGVYPRGSALELLDHLAILKGVIEPKARKRMVEALLVETNLFKDRKRRVSTYSGGMKQRFGIAQALLGQPKLVIVDEPTAGLDPEERNRFHNLLAEISEDVVVILSTHIVEDVSQLCSRMAIMSNGHVVSKGSPSNLISHFRGRIWTKNIEQRELSLNQSSYNVVSAHRFEGKLQIRICSDSDPGNGFQLADANLEDVYFASTQDSIAAKTCATNEEESSCAVV